VHLEKPAFIPIHRLALIMLALLAARNLYTLVMRPPAHWPLPVQLSTIGMMSSIWALVIWKIWTRPRAWGKGVGIVMVCMVPLHGWMWYRGLQYFRRMGQEMEFVPELLKFLPYEVLFGITGIVCIVLARRLARKEVGLGEVRG
jgi:hypothetical protein